MLPRKDLPEFLHKLRGRNGDKLVQAALRFIVLTMVRFKELPEARWEEFDFARCIWDIPAERMKMREPLSVPLSKLAIRLLQDLKVITGQYELLFLGRSDHRKPISENTLLYSPYRLGYHKRATFHGFRALASTILNECG